MLRGQCRACKQPIPVRYPLVEFIVGIWFAAVALHGFLLSFFITSGEFAANSPAQIVILAIGIAILGFLLIGLIVMDWQTHILPDAFTLTGVAIGLFLVCLQAIFLAPHQGDVILNTTRQLRLSSPGSNAVHGNIFLTGTEALVWGRLAAVIGAALLLLVVRWLYQLIRHREGLGLGDVKLIAMIAAFLGFWPAILALFIGVLGATAYALFLLIGARANRLTRLPLGSFISVGGLVASLFGNHLFNMYTTMLR